MTRHAHEDEKTVAEEDGNKPPVADDTAKAKATAKAKNAATEMPVSTRKGDSKPVFDADTDRLAAQTNGNMADLVKPAPTPTRASAVNMLMVSWSEMKLKFADFDHKLDEHDPAEAELQDVIDFLRDRL